MANHRQVLKKWFLISWFESDWGMSLLFTFVLEIKCSRNVNKLEFSKSKSFFFFFNVLGIFDLSFSVVGKRVDFALFLTSGTHPPTPS